MTDGELRDKLDAMEKDIRAVHDELVILKAQSGKLGVGWLGLILSFVASLVSAAFFIAQLAAAQASLATTINQLKADFHQHAELPGHPVMQERVHNLESTLRSKP
jgi:hypothetical protein